MEEKLLNISKLPSAQREKIERIFAEWPSKKEFPDILTYPQHKAVDEMTRDSVYKAKAFQKGLIKPFLLLVSMHPETRLRWSVAIKVPLLNMKEYGDSHAEAYKILTMDRKGLQARANHAFADTLNPLGSFLPPSSFSFLSPFSFLLSPSLSFFFFPSSFLSLAIPPALLFPSILFK